MRPARICLIAVATVLVDAAGARAEPPSGSQESPETSAVSHARTQYDRGVQLAAEKRYADAARELESSYALDPRRETLFAWAQVVRLAGDCPTAVRLYRQFVAVAAAPQEVEAATLGLKRCEREAERLPEPAAGAAAARPLPPSGPTAAKSATAPPAASGATATRLTSGMALPSAPPPPPSPARGGALTAVLLAGGAVLAATGGALFLGAAAAERSAGSALRYDAYHDALGRARFMQAAAVGLTAAGVSLGAAGVFRLVLRGGGGHSTESAMPRSPAVAGIEWQGVF